MKKMFEIVLFELQSERRKCSNGKSVENEFYFKLRFMLDAIFYQLINYIYIL